MRNRFLTGDEVNHHAVHNPADRRSLRERYPPPWHIEDTGGAYAITKGSKVLAYVYYREAHQGQTDRSLMKDEVLAMARAIAGLGERSE